MQNATAAEIVYGKCTDQPKNMQASEKNITMYNEQGSTLTFLPTCPFGQVTMIITCPKTNFACPKSFNKEGSKVVSFFYFLCDMFHPH